MRDEISPTLGMREKRLMEEFSHNVWYVERVGVECYRSTGRNRKVDLDYENQI